MAKLLQLSSNMFSYWKSSNANFCTRLLSFDNSEFSSDSLDGSDLFNIGKEEWRLFSNSVSSAQIVSRPAEAELVKLNFLNRSLRFKSCSHGVHLKSHSNKKHLPKSLWQILLMKLKLLDGRLRFESWTELKFLFCLSKKHCTVFRFKSIVLWLKLKWRDFCS